MSNIKKWPLRESEENVAAGVWQKNYKFFKQNLFFFQANIEVFKIYDGSNMARLTGHFKSVTSLAFSRGRFELFSGSLDRAILIWDCDRYDFK